MKTVSGRLVSSKPVPLSKAAKILSKFALRDNGASPAYAYYLKRASDSFNELVQLHKDLRVSGSERKRKKHRSSIRNEDEEAVESVPYIGEDEGKENGVVLRMEKKFGADGKRNELELDGRRDEVKEPKKKKKKKKRDESEGKDNGVEQSTQGTSVTIDTDEIKKKKKEAKTVEKGVSEGGKSNGDLGILKESSSHVGNGVSKGERVKKNKKINNGSEDENRENMVADLRDGQKEKKVSKKRKSEEMDVANGEVNDSAEKRMQNKKRKKGKSEMES